jgi:hypothetical protein
MAILERLLDAFSQRWGRTAGASGDVAMWFELTRTTRPTEVNLDDAGATSRRVDARGLPMGVTKG